MANGALAESQQKGWNDKDNTRRITVKWEARNAKGDVDAKGTTDWEIMICGPDDNDGKSPYFQYGTGIYLSCCPICKDGTLDKSAAFLFDVRYAKTKDADKLVDMFVRDYYCGFYESTQHERKIVKRTTKWYVAGQEE